MNSSPSDSPLRRPTIRDVAREAGVAHATASYALRNHPKIPQVTRERVLAAAAALGYQMNATVGRLMAELRGDQPASAATTLVWLNSHPEEGIFHRLIFLRPWLEGAHARARQLGWRLDEMWMHEPAMGAKRMRQILRARGIPGILLAPTHTSGGAFAMDCSSLAVATMARTFRQPLFHQAAADDFANTMTAHEALRGLGYKRIGFTSTPTVCEWNDQRQLGGYLRASLAMPPAQRLPPHIAEEWVRGNPPGFRLAFYRWFRRWKPDAIITPSRQQYEWLEEMGLRVPDDCGIAHLNLGDDVRGWAGIDQRIAWIAASAVDMLVGQIHRHESGAPPVPKEVLIRGLWHHGTTVRQQ